jgi:hypothetical protein
MCCKVFNFLRKFWLDTRKWLSEDLLTIITWTFARWKDLSWLQQHLPWASSGLAMPFFIKVKLRLLVGPHHLI